jgi:hypothetical protein
VDQKNSFSGSIQYFINIGGINCDPNVSIGDFLKNLCQASQGGGASAQGGSPNVQGSSVHQHVDQS